MKIFKNDLPKGFDSPIDLPTNQTEAQEWQKKNKTWWENNPMRYDWNESVKYPEFSKEFYLEIDKRFFRSATDYLPPLTIPFDKLIDFKSLKEKDVVEIGVGNGSHASLLAKHSKSFTGIDLTHYAVKSTATRFKLFGLSGKVIQMDAENLTFENESFDFVWSWGVIHHSSNTQKILKEIQRVLKPGGEAIIMVYHRSFWLYYFVTGFIRGIILGGLFKNTLNELLQKGVDGAIARHYKINEWQKLAEEYFDVSEIKIYGNKTEILPIPAGRIKSNILRVIPNSFSRFLTNNLKMGSLLVSKLRKLKP